MSDQDPAPKPPSKNTEKVPLMKDTVRVTLKSTDGAPAAPSASLQGAEPSEPQIKAPAPLTPPPPTTQVTPKASPDFGTKPPSKSTANVPLMRDTVRVSLSSDAAAPSAPSASMQGAEASPDLGANPPSKQTSSVPLMKETVRVTLKAADAPAAAPSSSMQGSTDAPKKNTSRVTLPRKATSPQSIPAKGEIPSAAPKPGGPPAPPAPPAAPVPTATPSPTKPLTAPPKATTPMSKTPTAAKPAPTIQLKTAGNMKPGASAPTIRLATSKAPVGAQTKSGVQPGMPGAPAASSALPGAGPAAATALPTQKLGAGGQATLPKATVQLTPPTKPLTAPGQTSGPATGQSFPRTVQFQQAPPEPVYMKVLSGFGLAASIALVTFQVMQANIWMAVEDNPRREDRKWSQLIE